MVHKRTLLSELVDNSILKVENKVVRINGNSYAIGRYCDCVSEYIYTGHYVLLEGINDETGAAYKVIAEATAQERKHINQTIIQLKLEKTQLKMEICSLGSKVKRLERELMEYNTLKQKLADLLK